MWPSKASMMMPQSGGGSSRGSGGERAGGGAGVGAFAFAPFLSLYPPSGSSTKEALPPSVGLGVGSSPQGYVDIDQNERRVRRRLSSEDRLQRNRERNRLHARKTRQRKKAHMTELCALKKELEEQQRQLKQAINDRQTAKILLVMSTSTLQGGSSRMHSDDDDYEDAMAVHGRAAAATSSGSSASSQQRGSIEGGRLQRVDSEGHFLNGGTAGKDVEAGSDSDDDDSESGQSDSGCPKYGRGATSSEGGHSSGSGGGGAINFALLSKDRSQCTPKELEEIRRERNRMHARRTRERKKVLLKQAQLEIADLCRENKRLQAQLEYFDSVSVSSPAAHHSGHSATDSLSSSSGSAATPSKRQAGVDGNDMSIDGLLGSAASAIEDWQSGGGAEMRTNGGGNHGGGGSSSRKSPLLQQRGSGNGVSQQDAGRATRGQKQGEQQRGKGEFKGDGSSDTSSDSGTSEEAVTISESDRSGSEGSDPVSSSGGNGSGKSSESED